jgi:hypothetical protein
MSLYRQWRGRHYYKADLRALDAGITNKKVDFTHPDLFSRSGEIFNGADPEGRYNTDKLLSASQIDLGVKLIPGLEQ